ncbi:hypothetical protein [Mucilaginibacter rubeus]|uniref:Uncharacterized protein n=1 Tax=Mucilaginibacter rubeus TaxID=2027860 RepID=A0A5C1I4E1_9SPHI|nr:hypothetical protein [Mucilaginibacter rubeus]QEM12190.1 hypothetical protein DEO27_019915 [Mucilaginibacter rubeus]
MDHLDSVKIKFTISQETNLDPQNLKETIVEVLTNSGYKVIRVTDSMIMFDDTGDNRWSLRGEKGFKMMQEGQFEILTSEKGATIQLTYYFDVFFEIILLSICLLGAIFGALPALIVGFTLLIQFLLKINIIKGVVNEMLLDILC